MAELQHCSSHEGPSEESTCLDHRCRGRRGAEGSIQGQSSPKISLPFMQSWYWRRNSFREGWEFQDLLCLVLTAPNWAAPLAWHACSKGDFALFVWNVGLQSPCAVNICYFCPEELCPFSLRKRGAPVEQHDPVAGNFQLPRTSGAGCTRSYPISSTSARMPFPTGAGLGWN